MKTERLIDVLARGAGSAQTAPVARRLGPAACVGVLASAALALGWIGPVPAAMFGAAALWMKLAYTGVLAVAAAWLVARLARPAASYTAAAAGVLLVLGLMALLGVASLLGMPAAERMPALLGSSWASCPRSVLGLSLPALAAALWALRGLAPTRPRLAGFASGLFAGALGAFGYALACGEISPAFVAVWYSAGIAITALLGAALGPLLLRW